MTSAAPAWRWVDVDGSVHYSDRPVPGAEEVNLPGSSNGVQSTSRPSSNSSQQPAPSQSVTDETTRYTRFDIISPSQQEVFWNVAGMITVNVAIEPALQDGHRLAILLDGQRQTQFADGSKMVLSEVYRGLHTVQAQIIDVNTQVVVQSLPVEFMVQQTSLQTPN